MAPVHRVSVVGNSGSGKSAFADALASRLGVPHVELDSIFHQPRWTPLPPEEFRRQVGEVAATDGWVIDGNYSAVRDLIWQRADTVVWLDLSRSVVMWRVVSRTLLRLVLRRELWNGNREPWSNLFSWDPMRSIIAWSWTQHSRYHRQYLAAASDQAWRHLRFVQLRKRKEVQTFLRP
jgi:adenylate kinase family enzyme